MRDYGADWARRCTVTSGDVPAASDLDPRSISQILESLGWAAIAESQGLPYQRWTNRVSSEQLLVPTDTTKADYDALLARVYRTLADEHGRAFEEVRRLTMLQARAHLDAIRWIKDTPLESGIIAWDVGEEMFQVARSSLAAAAKATRETRRYFGNSSAYIAKRFLADTLMGQTEVGSFIVTAYTPSDRRFFFSKSSEETAPSKMIDPESKTGADIIDKLDEIVTAVRGKLDEFKHTPNAEAFDEIVPVGFSYEMANALSLLARGGDGGIRIARTGAGTSRPVDREIAFDAVEAPVLDKVAVRFAATREPEVANLVGEVTLLDHISSSGDRTIRLHVSNHPGVRTVRVRLSADQYDDAIEAHRDEKSLKVTGTIEREGRYNWVYSPSAVSIVDVSDDDDDDPSSSTPSELSRQAQLSLLDDDIANPSD
ncbi:conserved hypothetical protein [uncultured Mycobacterium sp.]|uniref:Uncharacterized protein n=1 Tax=uncultured Mycobacterium sp. TaxID=171292 RepID=A0A1Y5PHX4_9MYCO|nr:conserved hypothetical protein [uncultured Mycobacterium sp.]